MKKIFLFLILVLLFSISACNSDSNTLGNNDGETEEVIGNEPQRMKNDDINDSISMVRFENDFKVNYVSGTPNIYSLIDNTIYFKRIYADTIYSITGSFNGNIVVMAKKTDDEMSVYCSNNTIVLKDTDWFYNNRYEMCKDAFEYNEISRQWIKT